VFSVLMVPRLADVDDAAEEWVAGLKAINAESRAGLSCKMVGK